MVIVYGGQRAGVYADCRRRGPCITLTECGGETSTGLPRALASEVTRSEVESWWLYQLALQISRLWTWLRSSSPGACENPLAVWDKNGSRVHAGLLLGLLRRRRYQWVSIYTGSVHYWPVIVYGGQRAGVNAGCRRRGPCITLTKRGRETSTIRLKVNMNQVSKSNI